MRVAVIGLGRIGGQLLRELTGKYPEVAGFDPDQRKVGLLRAEGLTAETNACSVAGSDVYLMAVSTGSQMENLFAAAAALAPAAGALISVESTILPGTMNKLAGSFKERGFQPGEDIFLVHTPHRILFGEEQSIFGQARVIGGVTPACLARGIAFYRDLVPALHPCEDIRLAEMTKIVENSLRYLEISCAEALALYCDEAGLDFDRLADLVNSKGNVRLSQAQYGIGGECLSKDVAFLYEVTGCRLLADAMAVDEEYRTWLARRAKAPRVLIRGLTFKPGWRDLGFSRAVELMKRLQAAGCEVFAEDPLYTPEELAAMGYRPWRSGEPVDKVVNWGKVSEGSLSDEDSGHR